MPTQQYLPMFKGNQKTEILFEGTLTVSEIEKIMVEDGSTHLRVPSKDFIQSVRDCGIIEPLIFSESQEEIDSEIAGARKKIILRAGRKRWNAAKSVGLSSVPVRIVRASDEMSLVYELATNGHRSDNRFTEFEVINKMIQMFDEEGLGVPGVKTLAHKTGLSEASVRDAIAISKLTPYLIELMYNGEIAYSTLADVARRGLEDAALRHIEETSSGDDKRRKALTGDDVRSFRQVQKIETAGDLFAEIESAISGQEGVATLSVEDILAAFKKSGADKVDAGTLEKLAEISHEIFVSGSIPDELLED